MKGAGLGAVLAIGLGLGATAAAGAAPLVVKSSGPSASAYPAGKAIAATQRIALKPGDVVVLLDGAGTRTLKGPGVFSPTMASTQLADSRDASPTVSEGGQRVRVGAVRSAVGLSDAARNPSIWNVDVAQSSNVCIANPAQVMMWRSSTDPVVMTISAAGGKSAQVAWSKGQAMRPWPAELPVASGSEYRLNWSGAPAPTVVKFTVLGPNPPGIEDMAAMLIKNKCQAQLDLLIETVSIPGQASPAG